MKRAWRSKFEMLKVEDFRVHLAFMGAMQRHRQQTFVRPPFNHVTLFDGLHSEPPHTKPYNVIRWGKEGGQSPSLPPKPSFMPLSPPSSPPFASSSPWSTVPSPLVGGPPLPPLVEGSTTVNPPLHCWGIGSWCQPIISHNPNPHMAPGPAKYRPFLVCLGSPVFRMFPCSDNAENSMLFVFGARNVKCQKEHAWEESCPNLTKQISKTWRGTIRPWSASLRRDQ